MPRSFSGRYPALSAEGLLLHAIVPAEAGATLRSPETEIASLRDLCAVVRRTPFRRVDATSDAITQHRQVVETLHRERATVPAPFGTVFRSRDSLLAWMELHYIALGDALAFVKDRSGARIRMTPAANVAMAEFETTVFDSLRFLKRTAVAYVTPEADFADRSAEASFLVERTKWDAFTIALREEQQRLPDMEIESSGPWPPYDFVRLSFGG